MNIIEINGLQKRYKKPRNSILEKREYFYALDSIKLTIEKNKSYSIVGESGSGKSTVALICSSLINYDSGSVKIYGEELQSKSKYQLYELRKKVQIIFQNSIESLNPMRTVKWNLEQVLKANSKLNAEEIENKINEGINSVGLSKKYLSYYPRKLSGGQAQRVAILCSMILEPEVLICDEITSALDVSVQAQILNLLLKMKSEKELTLIFITHDLSVAKFISDNVIIMEQGKIVEQGNSDEVFTNPKNPYSIKLLKSNISLKGESI